MPDWFEQYLKGDWELEGIYEDSISVNIPKPEPEPENPFDPLKFFKKAYDYTYTDPDSKSINLWFNLEADLMGKHVLEYDEHDEEVEYDVVYAKPSHYRWLD